MIIVVRLIFLLELMSLARVWGMAHHARSRTDTLEVEALPRTNVANDASNSSNVIRPICNLRPQGDQKLFEACLEAIRTNFIEAKDLYKTHTWSINAVTDKKIGRDDRWFDPTKQCLVQLGNDNPDAVDEFRKLEIYAAAHDVAFDCLMPAIPPRPQRFYGGISAIIGSDTELGFYVRVGLPIPSLAQENKVEVE